MFSLLHVLQLCCFLWVQICISHHVNSPYGEQGIFQLSKSSTRVEYLPQDTFLSWWWEGYFQKLRNAPPFLPLTGDSTDKKFCFFLWLLWGGKEQIRGSNSWRMKVVLHLVNIPFCSSSQCCENVIIKPVRPSLQKFALLLRIFPILKPSC